MVVDERRAGDADFGQAVIWSESYGDEVKEMQRRRMREIRVGVMRGGGIPSGETRIGEKRGGI